MKRERARERDCASYMKDNHRTSKAAQLQTHRQQARAFACTRASHNKTNKHGVLNNALARKRAHMTTHGCRVVRGARARASACTHQPMYALHGGRARKRAQQKQTQIEGKQKGNGHSAT